MKQLRIRKDKMSSIARKHPWIFSGAIESDIHGLEDGEIVEIVAKDKQVLAIGHFQHGTIAVRVLSFKRNKIDEEFYATKIQNAWELRKTLGLLSENNSIFRLIHGEGDNLPGLIIDFYNGAVVIQAHSIGMFKDQELIKNALIKVLGKDLKCIYAKNEETLPPRFEGKNEYLFGTCEMPHIALENGIQYAINWETGQKTGFFIDQRFNRDLLGKYAKDKVVLNTFCYSGGFSMSALNNGAKEVHSLDSSKKAIELTEENLTLNQFKAPHQSIVDNAVEYIKNLEHDYDVIILDPPAFAKHREKRHKAMQAYKRLNAAAIRQIKPGGIIFTFSCSQVVDKILFNNTVIAAAVEAGREVRILHQLHQPEDHPINAFHPEGEYLKGLVIEVH
ncbi:MAG: class I SAM-dependent rRNA methyltransferase [Crocinitomicaceae bacterium]|jgi:23S rRNA (cytosine1962-C5)-methyltransferase|nr:class I SAM-dependent rRNA methyltransferase [Crocinitomicaceae bacterium]